MQNILPAADRIIAGIENENSRLPAEVRPCLAGEARVLHTIGHVIIAEMRKKLEQCGGGSLIPAYFAAQENGLMKFTQKAAQQRC